MSLSLFPKFFFKWNNIPFLFVHLPWYAQLFWRGWGSTPKIAMEQKMEQGSHRGRSHPWWMNILAKLSAHHALPKNLEQQKTLLINRKSIHWKASPRQEVFRKSYRLKPWNFKVFFRFYEQVLWFTTNIVFLPKKKLLVCFKVIFYGNLRNFSNFQ